MISPICLGGFGHALTKLNPAHIVCLQQLQQLVRLGMVLVNSLLIAKYHCCGCLDRLLADALMTVA